MILFVRVKRHPPNMRVCEYGGIGRPRRLKISRVKRIGSTPITRTKFGLKVFTDAHSTVTAVDGDRYPIRPPNTGDSSSGKASDFDYDIR